MKDNNALILSVIIAILVPLCLISIFCTRATAQTYSTDFPLTENPISESGQWSASGRDWMNVRSTSGLAYGTQSGSRAYDDSTAILTGNWGPDQAVAATVKSTNQNDSINEEVEIRLRSSISSSRCTGYEVLFSSRSSNAAYVQIVRWNGALGDFTYVASRGGSGCALHNGDTVKATISGSTISAYINDVLILQGTDTTYSTGNPGMGFFLSGTGSSANSNFGFTSFTATGSAPTLFASFPGYGLWKWDGTAWTRLTSDMPESMVASGSTLYGDFGAQGLWKYDGSSWSLLTPDNPKTMAVSGSTLYAGFGSLGLLKYNGTSWSQLTSDNPENIVASGSTVYGDFGALGLWKWDGSKWSLLTTDNPENMAVSGTTLYVDFGPVGLWKYNGTSWSGLASDNPEKIAVSGSTLYGDFGSLGLWKWNGSSWTQLTKSNPENIVASGSNLYGDFGAIGLWKYNGTSWSELTSENPIILVTN